MATFEFDPLHDSSARLSVATRVVILNCSRSEPSLVQDRACPQQAGNIAWHPVRRGLEVKTAPCRSANKKGQFLKLRPLLQRAGVTEGAYNGLRQSGAASFISDRATRKDALQPQHLLAIKAFGLLRTYGVGRRSAGASVEAAFPAIRAWVDGVRSRNVADRTVGVKVRFVRGKLLTVPLSEDTEGGIQVGRIEFDIGAIASLLHLEQDD